MGGTISRAMSGVLAEANMLSQPSLNTSLDAGLRGTPYTPTGVGYEQNAPTETQTPQAGLPAIYGTGANLNTGLSGIDALSNIGAAIAGRQRTPAQANTMFDQYDALPPALKARIAEAGPYGIPTPTMTDND